MTLQTGRVQLSGKILVAFNFICVEPYGVKVSDIKAIFRDLNFTGKTSGWGSANFKNKAKQKKTIKKKNKISVLPCHIKLILLWRPFSHVQVTVSETSFVLP